MQNRSVPSPTRRHLMLGTAAALAALAAPLAHSQKAGQSHALILVIHRYADPSRDIRGGEHDVNLARSLARQLGFSAEQHIVRINEALTLQRLFSEFEQLRSRANRGDRVMVYFSGHGGQVGAPGHSGNCAEGLVAYDGQLLFESVLRDQLGQVFRKTGHLVFFNDSCFSGGIAMKGTAPGPSAAADDLPDVYATPKSYGPGVQISNQSDLTGFQSGARRLCGEPVNKQLSPVVQLPWAYVAGATHEQAAYPTRLGSVATRAWHHCVVNGGVRDLASLARCAQAEIDRLVKAPLRQQIEVVGNPTLGL